MNSKTSISLLYTKRTFPFFVIFQLLEHKKILIKWIISKNLCNNTFEGRRIVIFLAQESVKDVQHTSPFPNSLINGGEKCKQNRKTRNVFGGAKLIRILFALTLKKLVLITHTQKVAHTPNLQELNRVCMEEIWLKERKEKEFSHYYYNYLYI